MSLNSACERKVVFYQKIIIAACTTIRSFFYGCIAPPAASVSLTSFVTHLPCLSGRVLGCQQRLSGRAFTPPTTPVRRAFTPPATPVRRAFMQPATPVRQSFYATSNACPAEFWAASNACQPERVFTLSTLINLAGFSHRRRCQLAQYPPHAWQTDLPLRRQAAR